MKVNMTPNPLDVVTIHASQGDTEARQWEFELHNNGELIGTSDITEQLFFKAYKGGTEEILPTNGSVPTTAPFLGDIRYPKGLLTEQEFTYRQSPTEEDGLAKITDVKGNTLNWNQLVSLIISSTTTGGITYTVSGGEFTINGTASETLITKLMNDYQFQSGHKYLFKGIPSSASGSTHRLDLRQTSDGGVIRADIRENTIISIGTTVSGYITLRVQSGSVISNAKYAPQIIDLTMLGIDNLTDNEVIKWFANYFPLSYYSYNQGSLLSFMGNGIKTVGKNLLVPTATFPQTINGITYTLNADGSITANGTAGSGGSTLIYWDKNTYGGKLLADGTYKLSGITSGSASTYSIRTNGFGGVSITGDEATFTITDGLPQTNIIISVSSNVTVDNVVFKPMIRRANVTDNTFEPYTSSTLSLPISTYFPNGMKSAGNVYDELTPTKAITRIGYIDMGTLGWVLNNPSANIFAAHIDIKEPSDYEARKTGFINPKYPPSSSFAVSPSMDDKSMLRLAGQIFIRDTAFSDVTSFKTAMSGVYLYYELATPTETSFKTASLVTENAEIPLSNEDGTLIGKCTEELSAEPGFHDAKIKLTDSDGTCYSNKLQLHVERSPQ